MEAPKNSWKQVFAAKHQYHASASNGSAPKSKEVDERVVLMEDLEKRKVIYGLCGECNEPGTGEEWCQSCNAKRLRENFGNWTSGNEDIDKFIQNSQRKAVHHYKCLEWVPFNKFKDYKYVTRGGFGEIYSASWPEGYIRSWDIENKKWDRETNTTVVLKSLDKSSDFFDFLNEIQSHLQVYIFDVVHCFGITQHPDTKRYMMVLKYCDGGNLREYLNKYKKHMNYNVKIQKLFIISRGLLDIHNAGKVHKDFHSGNILFSGLDPHISDLGMCQSVKDQATRKGVFGVLPYMAPEVLRGAEYTEAADIYSFGVIMNELLSEEVPFGGVPHDHVLSIKICKGERPRITEDTPKLFASLISRCWDADSGKRPKANELYQILKKWNNECDSSDSEFDFNSEINLQIVECKKIRDNRMKNSPTEIKSTEIRTHPQAIYTSRLLDFKDLPEPVNSTNLSKVIASTPISEFFDCEVNESEAIPDSSS